MSDDAAEGRSCLEGGKRHRVEETALMEARATGGSVTCLDCQKALPQNDPLDLRHRADVV